MRYLNKRILLPLLTLACLALVTALDMPAAVPEENAFANVDGTIRISDLGSWKVIANKTTERKNGVLVHVNTKTDAGGECSVKIELYDVNPFDVFDADILRAFVEGIRNSGMGIVTTKSVVLGKRRYQCIFGVHLDTTGEEPLVVYIQQLVLCDGTRFHNVTIGSSKDELETNPEITRLLSRLTIQ